MNTLVVLGVISAWVTLITMIGTQNGLSPNQKVVRDFSLPTISISSPIGDTIISDQVVDFSVFPNVVQYSVLLAYIRTILLPSSSALPISYAFDNLQTMTTIGISPLNKYVTIFLKKVNSLLIPNNFLEQSNGTLIQLYLQDNTVVANYTIPDIRFVDPNLTVTYAVGLTVVNEPKIIAIGNIILSKRCIGTNIEANSALESIGNINTMDVTSNFGLVIESNPILVYVGNITTVSSGGNFFNFFGNTLLDVTSILQSLDESGTTSNFINVQNTAIAGNAFLNPAGTIAYNNLIGKGWNFFGW